MPSNCSNFLKMIFLLLIPFSNSWCQETAGVPSLSGRVITESGQALELATVSIYNLVDSVLLGGTLTDLTGSFEISLPEGSPPELRIEIQFLGYSTWSASIRQPAALGDIRLKSNEITLQEVVIGIKNPLQNIPGGYSLDITDKIASTAMNAKDLLERTPGIIIYNDQQLTLLGRSTIVVMIDGRPTHLSGAGLLEYLRQLQPGDIRQIIVKTTPSAKYQAEGATGIIDIKTNRKNQGLLLRINASAGTNDKYSGGAGFDYNTVKISAYAQLSYSHFNQFIRMGAIYKQPESNTLQRYVENYENKPFNSYFLNSGINIKLNDSHTIGALYRFDTYRMKDETGIMRLDFFDEQQTLTEYASSRIGSNDYGGNHFADVNYQGDFGEGESLFVDVFAFIRDRYNKRSFDRSFFSADGQMVEDPYEEARNADYDYQIVQSQADYTKIIQKKLTLEAGLSYSDSRVDNVYDGSIFYPIEERIAIDSVLSYQLYYQERIATAYSNFKGSWKKWQYEAGARVEYTGFDIQTKDLGGRLNQKDRSQINFFPSVLLSYKISESRSFGLAFSRRINRPRYEEINPYRPYSNTVEISFGNPDLRPTLSYNAEFSYAMLWGEKINLTFRASYSFMDNLYYQLTFEDSVSGQYLSFPVNLRGAHSWNTSVSAQATIATWWKSYLNLNGSFMIFDLSGFNQPEPRQLPQVSISVNNDLQLPKGLTMQVSSVFRTTGGSAQGRSLPYQSVDIGLSKKFFEDKLTVSLRLSDVFNTQVSRGILYTPYLEAESFNKVESRVLRIRMNYSFGKRLQSKAKRFFPKEDFRYYSQ